MKIDLVTQQHLSHTYIHTHNHTHTHQSMHIHIDTHIDPHRHTHNTYTHDLISKIYLEIALGKTL